MDLACSTGQVCAVLGLRCIPVVDDCPSANIIIDTLY